MENKIKFFDSHAHLNDERFDEDREQVIKDIYEDGIEKFVTAGYSIESSKDAIELSKKYNFIYSTCGISPNDIPHNEEELWKSLEEIEKYIKLNVKKNVEDDENTKRKLVAIGEIGLDYYWEQNNKELQKNAFIEQIKLANKYELPIVIHTREAVMDTLEILKKNPVMKKGVFHCCPLNRELVKEALKLEFYISFCGPITFKNSKNANEIIDMVPNNRMLIETDSPYLSPEPLRGKRNDPRNVKHIAKKIGEVKGIKIEEVAKFTYENAEKIFNI
ncbi:MAG: TatD family hydrolase [Clostridia bacterium]|nr:TatD family hydrolase [Clostridia bacterium]